MHSEEKHFEKAMMVFLSFYYVGCLLNIVYLICVDVFMKDVASATEEIRIFFKLMQRRWYFNKIVCTERSNLVIIKNIQAR